jgi:hypothetical protein
MATVPIMRIPEDSPRDNKSISNTPNIPKMTPRQPNAVDRFPKKTKTLQFRLSDLLLEFSFELSFI